MADDVIGYFVFAGAVSVEISIWITLRSHCRAAHIRAIVYVYDTGRAGILDYVVFQNRVKNILKLYSNVVIPDNRVTSNGLVPLNRTRPVQINGLADPASINDIGYSIGFDQVVMGISLSPDTPTIIIQKVVDIV